MIYLKGSLGNPGVGQYMNTTTLDHKRRDPTLVVVPSESR